MPGGKGPVVVAVLDELVSVAPLLLEDAPVEDPLELPLAAAPVVPPLPDELPPDVLPPEEAPEVAPPLVDPPPVAPDSNSCNPLVSNDW